jgi:MFS transporter, FHS family, L-fucose permease
VFKHIFVISNARSALLQTAYYGAYFTLAIPASFINRRFGYKIGVLTGLGVALIRGTPGKLRSMTHSRQPVNRYP